MSQSLPVHLQEMQRHIEGKAKEYGLDFYPTIYEILDYKTMNEVAAYGGFPTRYPHWRFGMDYEQLAKGYEFGVSKIYEMVINTVPAYAYLLEGNSLVDQKLVMSHVCGHVDFFKHNYFFSKTDRKMIDGMANHASLVRRHMAHNGQGPVENFIDVCLSLENLIDPMGAYIARHYDQEAEEGASAAETPKLKAKGYMEAYINPPEFIENQKRKIASEEEKNLHFPTKPDRDVLAFLIAHAPLERWQRDCLEIIRREAYYFAPQAMTKIMNEGWATYWHCKLMTEGVADSSEIVAYADACAGVLASAPGQLNPYKLGYELYLDIEDRWNKGKFGKEWDACSRLDDKQSWDKKLGLGREKIFEVRRLYSDVTFIDEFFTLDFCLDQKYYSFDFNDRSGSWEIASREFSKVKAQLLRSLTNRGQPFIVVIDGNFENRGELLLQHEHDGTDLDLGYAKDTLQNLATIWSRPVNLSTEVENKVKMLRWDENGFSDKIID